MNIKKGVFQNAYGGEKEFIERLRNEKEIVLLGTGFEAQRAYGFAEKWN